MKKLLALLLALLMLVSVVACGQPNSDGSGTTVPPENPETPEEPDPITFPNSDTPNLTGKVFGEDYISLYDKFGGDITIADVTEDKETGLCYITKDGTKYELGLDFLTMAMVYNTAVPEGQTAYTTEDQVYAAWWKLYIQRWNALLPEVPLYSNEYYDVYSTKITGVKEAPTNPFWSPASALLEWGTTKADGTFILGSSTQLSGQFRYASFGKSSPGSSDLDVQGLTNDYATVTTNKEGAYLWNPTVVKSHKITENQDGSKTYEIEIHNDLKYSDGSAITAKDFVIHTLVFSTPVASQAAGSQQQSGMSFVGFEAFAAYDGTNADAEGVSKTFSGIRLLDTYKFSVTVDAGYLPYYYDLVYASLSPVYSKVWLNNSDVKDDGQGCYLTDDFYAFTEKTVESEDKDGNTVTSTVKDYTLAAHIVASAKNTDTTYPYSGAYVVQSYDASTNSATLVKNEYYKGNFEGKKPTTITKVVYTLIVEKTQLEALKSGQVDMLAAVTGGDATNEALKLADTTQAADFDYVHYSRAGYGKLGFRADYGPAQFVAVRQAIAYAMNRTQFAKDFTGGYGGVADGPYYTGSWMYKEAVKQGLTLNAYATSLDTAIDVLVAGGWAYDKDGNAYASGVRYKKIAAADISENDKNYKSVDGKYVTTKVGDFYYMPLVINWYGTKDNDFTDLLVTGFQEADIVEQMGMVVQNTIGDFAPMLDELYQMPIYGYYSGTPMYNAFNFATGFTSAVYDYSYNMTVDPDMYDMYSAYYLKDGADIFWLK